MLEICLLTVVVLPGMVSLCNFQHYDRWAKIAVTDGQRQKPNDKPTCITSCYYYVKISFKPPWLQAATRHGPLTPLKWKRWANTRPILLRQGEPGTPQYFSSLTEKQLIAASLISSRDGLQNCLSSAQEATLHIGPHSLCWERGDLMEVH